MTQTIKEADLERVKRIANSAIGMLCVVAGEIYDDGHYQRAFTLSRVIDEMKRDMGDMLDDKPAESLNRT